VLSAFARLAVSPPPSGRGARPSVSRLLTLALSPGASPPIARFRCVACTQDNVWDVAPPLLFFVGLISFTLWKREEILHHHRD
jgi:hypothetical protein